ncbi:ABC transporter permease, partial [Richelia intracellularis]|uniref:ABC transporter permease n=1 Tax=Richelia intracellularis TaxID=1164990 RepID=UPI0012DCAC21
WQGLGLGFAFAIAAAKSIIQLLILGYTLDFILALNNIWAAVVILILMLTLCAITAKNSITKKAPFVLPLLWTSMFMSTAGVLLYANFLIFQPKSWYVPQYIIPLGAMVLNSTMSTAILTGECLIRRMYSSQLEIETHLSLGASPQQATISLRQEVTRTAFLPIINQMAVAGIFIPPGFMNGILISGVVQYSRPLQAASHQIVLLFMMATANLLTIVFLTQSLCYSLFNTEAQLK